MNWAEHLQRIPIFSKVPLSILQQLADVCSVRTLEPEQVLFRQGTMGSEVFVVISGSVRVEARGEAGLDVTIANRGAGDVIGEMAILENQPRSATVTATRFSRLLVLSQYDFTRMIERNPQLAVEMLSHLSGRIRQLSLTILESRTESLRERVHHYFLSKKDKNDVVFLDVPQRVVAQEIGCTREALSRNISQLILEGKLIKVSRSQYLIKA